jgi:GcrA cell cycle regulator
MSWTDDRVEQLKKMWLDGLSASQIANELANGITRNAVIGKVHRLGLSGRVKSPVVAPARARPKTKAETETTESIVAQPGVQGHAQGHVHGNLAVAMAPMPLAAPAPRSSGDEVVIPMSQRVSIMELRESMCRWPLGDPTSPDFRYCGSKMQVGLGPYCTYHARIAYQPAQERRRERDREKRLIARG